MIVVVDYGMGNLRSVQKGFEAAGHKAVVSGDPEVVGNADAIVLPGVGAFQDCMNNLKDLNLGGNKLFDDISSLRYLSQIEHLRYLVIN